MYHVEDRTSRTAKTAGHFILSLMHRTLEIFQLNLRKQREVQQSAMNDGQLSDFGILALTEPYALLQEARVTTVQAPQQSVLN